MGDPSPRDSNNFRAEQFAFLDLIANNRHMLDCGYGPFTRMVVSHNGTAWQAELDAEFEAEDVPPQS